MTVERTSRVVLEAPKPNQLEERAAFTGRFPAALADMGVVEPPAPACRDGALEDDVKEGALGVMGGFSGG